MSENRQAPRSRTLRSGKVAFNYGRSVVDCTVRNLSSHGACLELESVVGIPDTFSLVLAGDPTRHACRMMWRTEHRVGVAFDEPMPERRDARVADRREPAPAAETARSEVVRADLLALRSGLDEVSFGVVLLDQGLRAQFINRAFRKMWRLPDAKADAKPSFTTLLHHGCVTGAYEVPASDLDAYVAERVAHVKAGNPAPVDLRLTNGEALRFQCTALPAGGRMLSYTPVTDIVRHADRLDILHAALDIVDQGIILLDTELNATFINRAARALWDVPVKTRGKLAYADIVEHAHEVGLLDVSAETLDTMIARRLAYVRAGNAQPADHALTDGRVIRSQCTVLPGGGRMISYVDVSDLARHEAPALAPRLSLPMPAD
jgi:PAS domain-containing protein